MQAHRVTLAALGLVVAVGATSCGSSSGSPSGGSTSGGVKSLGSLTVGAAGFTESDILANMYAQLLAKAGYQTSVTDVTSTEVLQPSLEKGDIDVVPEYAATYADVLNVEINGKDAPSVASPDLTTTMTALRRLAGMKGLSALDPAEAVDQNAFAVTKDFAAKHNLKTLSDLGKSGVSVTIAGPSECATRPFCQPGLEKTYGIKVAGVDKLGFDSAATKKAVQDGKDQLAQVSTTDATLDTYDLVLLTDDKHLQNADNLVPIVNTKSLTPTITDALNKLAPVLSTDDLRALDKKVDSKRQKPADVARAYLKDKGLL